MVKMLKGKSKHLERRVYHFDLISTDMICKADFCKATKI